jgi:hypothetical protein
VFASAVVGDDMATEIEVERGTTGRRDTTTDVDVDIGKFQSLFINPRRNGASGSITIAAALSLIFPLMVGTFTAFFPPVRSFLKLELVQDSVPGGYELRVANVSDSPAVEVAIELTSSSAPVQVTAPTLVGLRYAPPDAQSKILALVLEHVPARSQTTVSVHFVEVSPDLAVRRALGSSVAIVGADWWDPFFVFPNFVYWLGLVATIVALIAVLSYYLWRASIAGYLNDILDVAAAADHEKTARLLDLRGRSTIEFLSELEKLWRKQKDGGRHPIVSRSAQSLPHAVDHWGLELRLRWSDTGGGTEIVFVAPFHIVGHPTFSRLFRKYHVLALVVDVSDMVVGYGWTRLRSLLDGTPVNLKLWDQ